MIGIYKITNPKGSVYIGQSIDYDSRVRKYMRINCKGQVKLYRSLKKYTPENHVFEIIEICSIEELNDRERYYQEQYDAVRSGLNCLLTSTKEKRKVYSDGTLKKMSASNMGKTHSEESKLKMSISRTGKKASQATRIKLSKAKSKMVFTDTHKRKISESKRGSKLSIEQKDKLRSIGKIIYENNGMPRGMLTKGMKHTHQSKIKMLNRPRNHPKRRMMVNVETGIFYESAAEAGRSIGVSHSCIIHRVEKKVGNFIFI